MDIKAIINTLGYSITYNLKYGCVKYIAENKKQKDFNNFCLLLEENNFNLIQKRSANNNTFATFVLDKLSICIAYIHFNNTISVVTDELYNRSIPPLTKKQFKENTTPKFSMPSLKKDGVFPAAGMLFILTLSDGSYIIYDGGFSRHSDVVLKYLKKHTRSGEKPVIAAWILTHGHDDHCGCIADFAKKFADQMVLEEVVFNPRFDKPEREPFDDKFTESFFKTIKNGFKGCNFVRPHLGQRLYYRDAVLDILHTAEDILPGECTGLNEASLVTSVILSDKKILMPADAEHSVDEVLPAMYGATLKSDILQVTHHGYAGGSKEMYDLIAPKLAFWAISYDKFRERIQPEWKEAPNYYIYKLAKQSYADTGEDIIIELNDDFIHG